jgi:hypothetical protein
VVRLHRFIANHVRYVVEQPDVMRVLVQEASALPPRRRAVIRALKQRYFAIGEALLRDVLARGPARSAVEIERQAYCMFGMLNWIFGWYTPAAHGTPDELARTILEMTVSGVSGKPLARELTLGAPNLQLLRTPLRAAQGH